MNALAAVRSVFHPENVRHTRIEFRVAYRALRPVAAQIKQPREAAGLTLAEFDYACPGMTLSPGPI